MAPRIARLYGNYIHSPITIHSSIFNLDMYIHIQSDNVSFTIDDHKTANEVNSSKFAAWSSILFGVICLLLNLASLFAYKLCRCQNAGLQNAANSQFERKMTIYTVFTFFGQFIMAIFTLIVYATASQFVDEQNNRYALLQAWFGITLEQDDLLFLANFNQCPWVNDLATVVIPAWLLLWASTKMRQIIAKKFEWVGRFEKKKLPSVSNSVYQQNGTIFVKSMRPNVN
uniref:7TM_GPCR_Srx domain-containing protein n=1 Tax=Globodera pallida TaxID=36090 RepID=A0A183C1G9_GLOPA